MNHRRLIVVGGGAAGLFAAVNAARMLPSLQVMLLEKSGKLLSKVKVSGGGRCNVTHACFEIDRMSRHYPRGRNFVRKAFHQFFTTDTIEWFRERGVLLHTEADGRMFPVSNRSQTIIHCLLQEAAGYRVDIRLHAEVTGILHEGNGFRLQLRGQPEQQADYVCVATGGYPKSALFEWLRQTGHHIEEPVPSLFTFNAPGHPLTRLMGVSVPQVRVKVPAWKLEQEGPLLITHWGVSGPVVLKCSAYGAREMAASGWQFTAYLNWVPTMHEQQWQQQFRHWKADQGASRLATADFHGLPRRLVLFFLAEAGLNESQRWADAPLPALNKLAGLLSHYPLAVKGKTTFREEFVTAGGIRLSEVDPATMMSRLVPGLFFAGEVMDVDGVTGGFNFQYAWTSGFIAAQSIHKLASA